MTMGNFNARAIQPNDALLAEPVRAALADSLDCVQVTPIDSSCSDTAAFCERYAVRPEECANCVIVEGKDGPRRVFAACMVLGNMRLDVNKAVRNALNVKKVSFAKKEDAVALSRMEFGAITPIGLPPEWPILVDATVAVASEVVIGSGLRASKLLVSGAFLSTLPNATVITGLAYGKEVE